MNHYQELWWQRAKSDFDILTLLRKQGAPGCHQLHYLQMAGEKLAKAYSWGTGRPPPKNHSGLVEFLRHLSATPRIQGLYHRLGFRELRMFERWIRSALHVAYELERLAPSLAGDGPNPEYPWPHAAPAHAPSTFKFAVYDELRSTAAGRSLFQFVEAAIHYFPEYV